MAGYRDIQQDDARRLVCAIVGHEMAMVDRLQERVIGCRRCFGQRRALTDAEIKTLSALLPVAFGNDDAVGST